ncbi:NnrU family protein [Aliiroseovarius sp. 2305UL8-7]|uniref:NnrU family protein n=1 Tax=Aliiroseovarius conchicola TaxID=3121637 RepID=UPI003527F12C
MPILILGLALWYAGHFWKRVVPAHHAAMGSKARGISALVILVSVVVMVIGFKLVDSPDLLLYPAYFKPLNNIAIVFAFYLVSPGPSKGALFYKMRHPMLTGFIVWAVAHIIVNPDLGSMVLFGGLTIWAVAEIIVINRAEPDWQPNPKGAIKKDAIFFGAAIVLTLVVGTIHDLVGPSPFGM